MARNRRNIDYMNPAAKNVDLGALLDELIASNNALRAAHDALVAKLDTDFTAQNVAVTGSQLDVDYASSTAVGGSDIRALDDR